MNLQYLAKTFFLTLGLTVTFTFALAYRDCAASIYKYRPSAVDRKADLRSPIKLTRMEQLAPSNNGTDIFSDVVIPKENTELNSDIFDANMSREMKEHYLEYEKAFQANEPYQLNEQSKQWEHDRRTREVMDWAMSRLVEYHVDKFISQPPKTSKTLQTVSRSMKKVQEVQNPEVKFSESTQAKFRLDLPNSRMRLKLTSPLFNTEAELRTRPLNPLISNRDPGERVSVGANRKIEFTDTTAYVNYGLDSSQINFGANQELFGPFSAQVQQSHFFAQPSRDETVYRLNMTALLPQ